VELLGQLAAYFDHIVLLSAPAEVLLEVEPRLRATATIEIDAAAPISQVVEQLEALA
jgi:hypothetical protein